MIKLNNNNIEYIALNILTNDIQHIYNTDLLSDNTKLQLQEYNNKGYNIYRILNDFNNRRTEDNILGFNYIGLDLDNKNYSIEEIVSILGDNVSYINSTYKGYHIFIKLSPELYNITSEDYKSLYTHFNSLIGGDNKMKSITSILKVEGYIDHKERRSYTISRVYTSDSILNKQTAVNILNKSIQTTDNKLSTNESKKENKEIRNNMIESICSLELIDTLQSMGYKIHIDNNTIDNTNGLKIYKENDKYTIKDFAGKNRFGNKFFILNHVLKNYDGNDKMIRYSKILNEFGIHLNENYTVSKFPLFYILGFKHDNILEKLNNVIMDDDKGLILKIMIAYNYIRNKTKQDFIKEKDIIEILDLSISKNSKDKIREGFIKLAYLKIRFDKKELENDSIVNIETFKNLVDIEIQDNNIGEKLYKITFLNNINKLININTDILKIKDDNKFYTSVILVSNLYKNKAYKISIEELKEITGISTFEKIRERYLNVIRDNKIIKGYKKEGEYVIYY